MPMVAAKPPFTLFVIEDNMAENPRTENDNFGTMICFHRRYSLGDKHTYDAPREFLIDKLLDIYSDKESGHHNFDLDKLETLRMSELLNLLEQSNEIVLMPLYLYDHSGITMSTSPFSCPWDSGQVGWIYADRRAIEAAFSEVNAETLQKAKELLESEVKLYDHYLTGDVYGYQLFERDTKIDSCWGFIGDIRDVQDQIKEYLPEECREIVEGLHYEYDSLDINNYLQNEMEDEEGLEQ